MVSQYSPFYKSVQGHVNCRVCESRKSIFSGSLQLHVLAGLITVNSGIVYSATGILLCLVW